LRGFDQRSYLVLTLPSGDPRTLRLYDMKPRDVLTVQCTCGHIGPFAAGELRRRVFSDMPIWDLHIRCAASTAGARRECASSSGTASRVERETRMTPARIS
jgi:hypothetical protein